MATVTPVLWKSKKNSDGLCPVYLRISDTNKTRYVSLKIYVRETQWNERKNEVRSGRKDTDHLNKIIKQKVSEAQAEILRLKVNEKQITADKLKRTLKTDSSSFGDFFEYADHVVIEFERRGKIHSHKRFKTIRDKFEGFAGRPLSFDDLTSRLLRDFETHLIEHHDNSPNTVASNLKAIRTILYRAIKDGLFPQEKNPFFQFKIRNVQPQRDKLNLAELEAIENLKLKEGALIWHVRNFFLFSFYCAGIRFGDLADLKHEHIDNGRLRYRMGKTGSGKSLKLLPQALEILEHYDGKVSGGYLFPILDSYDTETAWKKHRARSSQNALVNKYLKKIAEKAEIQTNLSFHVARHSFADIARQKGWDVYAISKALGHANLKVTENYLKGFDSEALDDKMDDLFGDGS